MITSHSNEMIKSVRKLRDKKYREASNLAYVEGIKLVIDALDNGAIIDKLIISETFDKSTKRQEIISRIDSIDVNKTVVSDEVFRTLSTKDNPQGVVAVIQQKWMAFEAFVGQFTGLWVALWEVADPGNLGSIMRTVDAVNARGVILLGNCTDPYDPGAIRGSMGAVFSNILVKSNMQSFIDWIHKNEISVIGTSDAAKTYYREVRYPENMVLTMGSERQGLPAPIVNACKELVRIPMGGISDSLNLAVATGIVLYEIFDQHKG